jgi:NADH:ubiquinone oxidoreductase subunit F (NADH-binding)
VTATAVAGLLAGVGEVPTYDRHLALYGPAPRHPDLIETLAAAGLRGRGGGAFPTARKLEAVARRRGRAVVVANGVEGEPASKKDRALLRVAPHLVLDGAALAAAAVGARRAVLAISTPAPELGAAIGERQRLRVDRVDFSVCAVPAGFVSGEETAVVRAIAGKAPKPTLKPPYPFERGVDGAPTLVQNVETLAQIALIARYGGQWSDTTLVTLSGSIARPGVHEIPSGTTLADAVRRAGGLTAPVSAYLVGGYFGRWVHASAAEQLELTPDVLGAGAIVALPDTTCPVGECARVVRYLAAESAGQCGPCVHGLAALAETMRSPSRAELERLGRLVAGRGACRHPDGAVRFVQSAVETFADEFARHAHRRGCGRRLLGVLPAGDLP